MTLQITEITDLYFQLKEEKRETLDIDFGLYLDVTKARHLDVYEDIYTEMVYASKFDENSDLSTTYLGQTNMTEIQELKWKKDFSSLDKGLLQENC